jgi:hypothetical protein
VIIDYKWKCYKLFVRYSTNLAVARARWLTLSFSLCVSSAKVLSVPSAMNPGSNPKPLVELSGTALP